jgi:hypothetical protein
MSVRVVSMVIGVVMMLFGGILVVPVTGPLLASTVGFLFLATGLVQVALGFASASEVTCPHCQKRSGMRVGLWSATPRLTSRDDS